MKRIYHGTICALYLMLSGTTVYAQSTFSQVHHILQTNCSASSCHNGSNPMFDATQSESDLYADLVNVAPLNPEAAAKGNKLVSPGYVDRSFLLRKISGGLAPNPHLALDQPSEGNYMPYTAPSLAPHEIELVRQWILFGAPLTGNVVDTAVINTYYRGKGIDDTYPNHTPPAPGEGFQIYVGKVFIPANTEIYYYIKHDLRLPSSIEIPKITTMLASATHHFVIFKFLPGGAVNYGEGLRLEAESSHADVSDGIGTGPNLWEYELPANTAYFWEQNSVLDFNLHIFNNRPDTVLATDLYINVYTQPVGTADKFMLIRNFPVFSIVIPPDSMEHEFIEIANDTNETKYWNVWQLYGHTHQYGTDYDIFKRNPDGSIGSHEYESWMSYEQGFNVGYHRYGVDATFRFYPDDELLEVDPRIGWIHRARYRNTSNDTIAWGLTSAEEMMVMGFQFVYGDDLEPLSTGVTEGSPERIHLNVFPNPVSHVLVVNYILHQPSDVVVELTNILGETISIMEEKSKQTGNYVDEIDISNRFAPGVYMLSFRTQRGTTTQRIVIE